MGTTEWKTAQQSGILASSAALGTLLQLTGKLLSDAIHSVSMDSFLRTALGEVAAELSVQWIGLGQRTADAGWEIIAEHGQQTAGVRSQTLWDGALERGAAGLQRTEQGRVLSAFPLQPGTPCADLLVTAGRFGGPRPAVSSATGTSALHPGNRLTSVAGGGCRAVAGADRAAGHSSAELRPQQHFSVESGTE